MVKIFFIGVTLQGETVTLQEVTFCNVFTEKLYVYGDDIGTKE